MFLFAPRHRRHPGPGDEVDREVMGLDLDFGHAFAKSQLGASSALPVRHGVHFGARPRGQGGDDRPAPAPGGDGLQAGRHARGTAEHPRRAGLEVAVINKVLRAGRTSRFPFYEERRGASGLQHDRGRAGDGSNT